MTRQALTARESKPSAFLTRTGKFDRRKAKETIAEKRKSLTRIMFNLAELIQDLPLENEHADRFLAECGLPLADVQALRMLHLVNRNDIIEKKRVSFETVKALTNVDEATREKCLFQISAGRSMTAEDVRETARASEVKSLTPREKFARERNSAFRRASNRIAREAEKELQRAAGDLSSALRHFRTSADIGEGNRATDSAVEEYNDAHANVVVKAVSLSENFIKIFGEEFPGPRKWDRIQSKTKLYLAQADFALRLLSAGQFGPALPGEDGQGQSWSAATAIEFLAGNIPDAPTRFKAVDLSAMQGTTSRGILDAGFDLHAIFTSKKFAEAATSNLPKVAVNLSAPLIEVDVLLTSKEVLDQKDTQQIPYGIDLATAVIPRNAWNSHGQGLSDPRDLLGPAISAVEKIQPKSFFFELPVRYDKGPQHAHDAGVVSARLAAMGYETKTWELNANDYGLLQDRGRRYLLGIKSKYASRLEIPRPVSSRTTVASALKAIAFPFYSGAHPATETDRSQSQRDYDLWATTWLEKFGGLTPLPDLNGFPFTGFVENTLRKWEKHGFGWLKPRPDPVDDPRIEEWRASRSDLPLVSMTVDLLRVIQALPEGWQLGGSLGSQAQRISRSYPPIMGRVVSEALRRALTGGLFDPSNQS